jgi:tRNA-splicing ligase RtcB
MIGREDDAMTNLIDETLRERITPTEDAMALLPVRGGKLKPVTMIGTEAIRATFDDLCLQQAVNSAAAPGVSKLVLNPDAHCGYGAPVGSVLASPTHIYPGPVGVDIKCSMSLMQFDLPAEAIEPKETRRALINAICERIPTGPGKGQRSVRKGRYVHPELAKIACIKGAARDVLKMLELPPKWRHRCEDAAHFGHDGTVEALEARMEMHLAQISAGRFADKMSQLGSYGGGNHFGECEIVQVGEDDRAKAVAESFGLKDGCVAFLSHCGSRGFGHDLAMGQFRALQARFETWGIPLPGGDEGAGVRAARYA